MILHSAVSRTSWRSCRLKRLRNVSPGLGLGLGYGKQSFASAIPRRNVETQPGGQESWSACCSFLSSSTSAITSAIASSPIRQFTAPAHFTRIPLLAILVTPAHLKLLHDSEGFVPNLLRQVFLDLKGGQKLDVVAAVVDRIPFPTPSRPIQQAGQASARKPQSETQIRDGSEGVSFFVLPSASAAPDLWDTHKESKERGTMTIQQRCTLSFALPPTRSLTPSLPDGKARPHGLVSRTLRLPVANTVFQNGKTATLTAQRWRVEPSKGSSFNLSCLQESPLPQQVLRMTKGISGENVILDQSLHSYLLPITPTRKITAAVGNIIRRILVDSTRAEGSPASEELEKAIPSAIKSGQMPAEQVGIWALVKPANHHMPGTKTGVDEAAGAGVIQEAILTGCRLHKVLSGGGGWGKKQGLLALDPDSHYSAHPESFEAPSNVDIESENLQGLGEAVKPGDTVKFYVYRSPSFSESSPEPQAQGSPGTPAFSISFGSLPSTADLMPNSPSSESEESDCTIIKNHFGMLSEQGMSLQSTFMEETVSPNITSQDLPPNTELGKIVSTTKLDAPYTTFSFKGLTQGLDLPIGANGESLQGSKPKLEGSLIPGVSAASDEPRDSRGKEMVGVGSPPLEEFLNALSSMPPHWHSGFIDTHGNTRGQSQAKTNDQKPFTELPTLDRRAMGFREVTVGYPRIRKHGMEGSEDGVASIPLSQFKRVQSRIGRISSQLPNASDPKAAPGAIVSSAERPRVRRVDYGPRIHKHQTLLPLLSPSLSSSARRRVLSELASEDDGETTAKDTAESNLKSPMRHRDHAASADPTAMQTPKGKETEVKRATPQVRFLAEKLKTSFPENMPASAPERVSAKQERPPSGRQVRIMPGNGDASAVVRKHLSIFDQVKASVKSNTTKNSDMAPSKASGRPDQERPKWKRRRLGSQRYLIRKEHVVSEVPPAHRQKVPTINKYQSEWTPVEARDKARRNHYLS